MGYVPYTLLNRSELSYLADMLQSACVSWVRAWLGEVSACTVTCHRAAEYGDDSDCGEATWKTMGVADGPWIAASISESFCAHFGAALIESEPTVDGQSEIKKSPLLREVSLNAVVELQESVLVGSDMDSTAIATLPSVPDARCRERGSGTAIAEITCGRARLVLLLDRILVAAMLRGMGGQSTAMPPLDSVTAALGKERMSLQVMVGEAQLELGLLQTIVVGDVIRLDARIDQPLQVVNAEGVRLCGAYLGTQGKRKSIQLTT